MANEFELSFQGDASLYVILRRTDDATVWNGSDFVTWNDAHIASYDLPLTARGGDVYQGNFPGNIPPGVYRAIYYLRTGESPSIDDLLLVARTLHWQVSDPDDEGGDDEPVEVASDALTTVEAVCDYLRLGDLSTQETNLLASLVNQVSARIERICGRRFASRPWVDRYARNVHGRASLRHYPVIHIDRITAGDTPCLGVQCDLPETLSAGASVHFDDAGSTGELRLHHVSAAGEETTTALSLTIYPTTPLLAAAVNDLAGWSATVIKPMVSAHLHAAGKRSALRQRVTLSAADQELSWWDVDAATGTLSLWHGDGRVVVAYRAGYASIPGDLQLAATELVAQAYQLGRQNPSLKSESLGDYSYTLATQTQIADDLWSRLRLYMEVR